MVIKVQRKLRKIDDEQWREVPESNNRYFVSNYGRLKSYYSNKKDGQILKATLIKGYPLVQLNINKGIKHYYIHKLVAQMFINRPSESHIYVTHIDRNKINNHVLNLKWITKEQFEELNRIYVKFKTREKLLTANKLKEDDVRLLKSMLKRGVQQNKIAKMFCISEMQVTRIKRGENWGYIEV